MIGRIFLRFVVLIGVIILTGCQGTELKTNEAEAKVFLNQTSDKLFKIFDEVVEDTLNPKYPTLLDDPFKEATYLRKVNKDARKFDFENFKDEDLKYAFRVLTQAIDLNAIKEKRITEFFDSLQDLEYLLEDEYIEDFKDLDDFLPYSPDVKKIIKTSNDPNELQYYWEEWRKITDNWAEHNLDKILRALKEAAKINNVSPLEFWSRGFNITDMESLMDDIKPLYVELHAFIRNLLRKKYGDSVIAADGLIPDHLFQQVLAQAQTNGSIIEEMFPYESLPPVESVMAKKFKSQQLYEIAEGFYESLGFEKYPSSVWGDRIKLQKSNAVDDSDEHSDSDSDSDESHKDKSDTNKDDDDDDEEDEDCEPAYHYSTPKILLAFCEKMKFNDFLDAYAIMGYLHYAKEMVGLPVYFFKAPQDLEDAIGEAVTLSASTHHNLKQVGLIDDFKITPEVEMNRLLRMAIKRLIDIPMDFVYSKVMADLLSGNVKKSEIGRHYWQLMDKYVGVGPPKDHKMSTFDLPYSFYEKMSENFMSMDFTMDILSYKIHKKLCELSGKYPKEELHLCDINGSKVAGNALKTMMQLGSSKPLHEVLATMFPNDPTVKADGLLEFYSPIKKLLADKNKEGKVTPGWK